MLVMLHGLELSFVEFLKCLFLLSDLEVERDKFALIGGLDSLQLLLELSFNEGFLDLGVFEALGQSLEVS